MSKENESLKNKLAECGENEVKIREKYETLLAEANAQCEKLDVQLKNALVGKIDESVIEQMADVDKLKKKIKELEDDIEEYEDDNADLKKKIKNKDEEFGELQESFYKSQKISKQLESDLCEIKQKLEEKTEELSLKIGSLNFIQEILSAKEISTEDTLKLYKNIDFFESFLKGQYMDLVSQLYNAQMITFENCGIEDKKKSIYDLFDQWASTKRKSWLDGKTTIAFVGEFSAGKTSIVNRILSQDDPNIPLLPVSTKATTAIPTYIAGGSAVTYSFISGDGKRKAILEDTFKKVSKEILDQIKGVSSLIKYFVMTYKNPNLKGLSILDTPGFSSNDAEDRERTIDVINECDALFWVFDVNAGTVNRSSISIIKEKLNKPLFVVINKVDTKSDSEVKKVEDLIKKTLQDEGLSIQGFIRFSAKAPLTTIMNPIKSVSKIATRDTFVHDMKEDVEALLNNLNDTMKNVKKEYDEADAEGDEMTEQFVNSLRTMQEYCSEAYGIPHWEEHWFSSDRFEMNKEEGNRLRNLLELIADDTVQDIANIFDERIEKAAEIQQRWSDYCDVKNYWQKTNECYEQYKKVVKEL